MFINSMKTISVFSHSDPKFNTITKREWIIINTNTTTNIVNIFKPQQQSKY